MTDYIVKLHKANIELNNILKEKNRLIIENIRLKKELKRLENKLKLYDITLYNKYVSEWYKNY